MNNEPVKVKMEGYLFTEGQRYILLTHLDSDELYADFLVTTLDYNRLTADRENTVHPKPFVVSVRGSHLIEHKPGDTYLEEPFEGVK